MYLKILLNNKLLNHLPLLLYIYLAVLYYFNSKTFVLKAHHRKCHITLELVVSCQLTYNVQRLTVFVFKFQTQIPIK